MAMAQMLRRKALCIISSEFRPFPLPLPRTFSSSPPLPDIPRSSQRVLPHRLLREPSHTNIIQASFSPLLTVPSRLLASRRNTTAACPPSEPAEEYTGDLDVEEAMADLNMSRRLDDKMPDFGNYGADQEEEEGEYEEEEPAPDPEADALFSPAEDD